MQRAEAGIKRYRKKCRKDDPIELKYRQFHPEKRHNVLVRKRVRKFYQFEGVDVNEPASNIQGLDYHSYIPSNIAGYEYEFKRKPNHKTCLESFLRPSKLTRLKYEYSHFIIKKTNALKPALNNNLKKRDRILQNFRYKVYEQTSIVYDGTERQMAIYLLNDSIKRLYRKTKYFTNRPRSAYKLGPTLYGFLTIFREELDILWYDIIHDEDELKIFLYNTFKTFKDVYKKYTKTVREFNKEDDEKKTDDYFEQIRHLFYQTSVYMTVIFMVSGVAYKIVHIKTLRASFETLFRILMDRQRIESMEESYDILHHHHQ